MAGVRWTGDSGFSGMVNIVQLRGADTNIQPIVKPGRVGALAGGTQVAHVGHGVLHPLQDPDLPG